MEQVGLVGVRITGVTRQQTSDSLSELTRLVETVRGEVVYSTIQTREEIDPAYYIGYGKVEELRTLVYQQKIRTLIFDEELSPAQQRNLEDAIGTKIIDRTRLILDIFAHRAHSREGSIQVELAQLTYLLPRLTGKGIQMSQQLGGIGTRGPGERKLELDRYKIRNRIASLRRQIDKIRSQREIHRQTRKDIPLPTISLVGYTNAGKSSLLNVLTKSPSAYVDDLLFATLDPLTRKVTLPGSGTTILLTDTVGFIRKLPHMLVAAFQATLEEVQVASLLCIVVDISNPYYKQELTVVRQVLTELGTEEKPKLIVYNKIDKLNPQDKNVILNKLADSNDTVFVSCRTGEGIPELIRQITEQISSGWQELKVLIPYTEPALISYVRQTSVLLDEKFTPRGIKLCLRTGPKTINRLKPFTLTSGL